MKQEAHWLKTMGSSPYNHKISYTIKNGDFIKFFRVKADIDAEMYFNPLFLYNCYLFLQFPVNKSCIKKLKAI